MDVYGDPFVPVAEPTRDLDELLDRRRAAILHRDMAARDAKLLQTRTIRGRFFPEIDDVGNPRLLEALVLIR